METEICFLFPRREAEAEIQIWQEELACQRWQGTAKGGGDSFYTERVGTVLQASSKEPTWGERHLLAQGLPSPQGL